MKLFSAPGQPLDQDRAWICLLINQAATPGLGSIRGGRRVGWGQLVVASAGFCLIVLWMYLHFMNQIREQLDAPPGREFPAAGNWGAFLFLTAWCWAWFTSISLLREAKRLKATRRQPPKLW